MRLKLKAIGRKPIIDDASALADHALPHTMQRLQVELIGGLRRHKLHRWTLHRLGDRLRVAEVVLLPRCSATKNC